MQKELWRKYRPFPPVDLPDRQWPSKTIDAAPVWCSVDLRDGNQALVEPMNLEEKLEMFALLVRLGFKEIEVAFPSASEVEFQFVRTLIDRNLIPDDVTIQVLTQAREHLIRRTFDSIRGSKQAIVHLYNSTSTLQRRVVFGMGQEEITGLAVSATKLIKELKATVPETHIRLEYSPESFTGTELDYALRICEAVVDVWEPTVEEKIILNLPSTVELATPNVYADQIEWICRNLRNRETAIISLHTHNDRGAAIAAAELGMMAGADRVEGTLFGYGERTGNVDLVTLALNLFSQGVDPKLVLDDLQEIIRVVQKCTDNPIHIRHPYAGELVFTAFSGSHQDAINKGMRAQQESTDGIWAVPYLTIDPKDIGRDYEAIIRVNSQSGKGGVAYILRKEYGLDLPKAMQPEFSQVIQRITDATGKEILAPDLWEAFSKTYLETTHPYELVNFNVSNLPTDPEHVECRALVRIEGKAQVVVGVGNGPIEAFCNALRSAGAPDFEVLSFQEHSVGVGADAKAASYVQMRVGEGTVYGAAVDPNASASSLQAIVSGLNRAS